MEELLNNTWLKKKFKKGNITEEEFEDECPGSIRTASLGPSDVEGPAGSGASGEQRSAPTRGGCLQRLSLRSGPWPSTHGCPFRLGG